MKARTRKSAFATSQPSELIEIDQQLGYKTADGMFLVICDLRHQKRRKAKRASELLKEFLEATPNLREQAKAGLVAFSVQDGIIYCHTTVEGFRANGPGSPGRMLAIDNWRKATLTPEQYAEEKKKPVKKLEGAELDAWAKAQFAENERVMTQLKQNHGRRHKSIFAHITKMQPAPC